jgi:acyl carrier protein
VEDVKKLLAENCMLKVSLDSMSEETILFGPEGLGLDSIDALQLTMAIEKTYGLSIKDAAQAREIFLTVGSLLRWINSQIGG